MTADELHRQRIVYARGSAARVDLDAVLSCGRRRCPRLFCGGATGLAGQVGRDQHSPRGAAVLPERSRDQRLGGPRTICALLFASRWMGLSSSGAFLFARLLPEIRRLHEQRPIRVIHAHSALPCGHAASLLSRELKIPFVVTVHGLDAFSTRQVGGYAGEWCARVSRSVYRTARSVICVSEKVRNQVIEGAGNRVNTTVLYNGVDPQMFSPPDGEQERTRDSERWQSHSSQRARVAFAGLCGHSRSIPGSIARNHW